MKTRAFTLIEILVVVAIISILATIAIPNYIDAQTRSKVARVQADMKAFDAAIITYVLDHNKKPPTHDLHSETYNPNNWWGFLSPSLTTPVAYLTGLPPMVFADRHIQARWVDEDPRAHRPGNQPCTYVRDTYNLAYRFSVGQEMTSTETLRLPAGSLFTQKMRDTFRQSGYVLYSCGPDKIDSTALALPEFYDPTNGVDSYGDIYYCGAGAPEKKVDDPAVAYQPGHG